MKHFFTLLPLFLLNLITNLAFAQDEVNLAKGLVVHYNFNNNLLDHSGGQNHIISQPVDFQENVNHNKQSAAYVGNKILRANMNKPIYSEDYTVSFWLKADQNLSNTKSKITLIDHAGTGDGADECFAIYYQKGEIHLEVNYLDKNNKTLPYDDPFPISIVKDSWYFIAYSFGEVSPLNITINETTKEIGVMDKNLKLKLKDLNNPLIIGGNGMANLNKPSGANLPENFKGVIDDVRIYNRILSEEEILKLYETNGETEDEPQTPILTQREQTQNPIFTEKVAPPTINDKRIALVMGNADYEATAKLKNPLNDAKAMIAELTKLGFNVKNVLNGNRKQMLEAISEFSNELASDKNTTGLFYYAGHGIQAKGKNYLIPIDAKIIKEADIEINCIDLNNIMAYLEEASNNMNMIILDACRNNPYSRSFRSTVGSGLATVSRQPKGTFLAYATAPGTVAADGDGDNGLYTSELIKALEIPNLKLEDVFKKVRANVSERSNDQQIPWDNSSLIGDFYFKLN